MPSSASWQRTLSFWRAVVQPFGPVLFYELVRTGRRGRFILLRSAYALILLLALWAVALKYGGDLTIVPNWGPGIGKSSDVVAVEISGRIVFFDNLQSARA